MTQFKDFKKAVQQQFDKLSQHELFVTDISKDKIWDTYLKSFPEGTNPLFRERTEHDCQCCKQFFRACGNVVAIIDGNLESIWDIEIGGHYQVVADELSKAVKNKSVTNVFLHYEKSCGTDHNFDTHEAGLRWNHFHYVLPENFVNTRNLDTVLGEKRSNKEVLKRSLTEITVESAETVLELIEQGSLYRGEEHKAIVDKFVTYKGSFDDLLPDQQDLYCWNISLALGNASKIRNTVIGTLLTDISDGMELDKAVKAFEKKVAPENYKRPTALITQGMINKAQEKVAELGIESSLYRRYAVTDDVTINNVLFADRSVKQSMGVFDELSSEIGVDVKKFDKVDEVSIADFIENILPKATSLELLFENKHNSNLMSLIAPVNADSPNILKWPNNFSWAYNGEVADSMKERVKNAGGDVTGDLRFSIQWNDQDDNNDDLDAHCVEPFGNTISYSRMRSTKSGGVLDVDITQPNHKVAVENITWRNRCKMPVGDYKMLVHCYAGRNARSGFTAQIEFDGTIHDFSCDKPLRNNQKIEVAIVNWNGEKFTLKPVLQSSSMAKTVWEVSTQQFHKVNMLMSSPNHWDGRATGNKHWFFIIDECINDDKARGFFNEFLKPELIEHRKVFEVLGSKMKTEKSDEQLSGLGFSSTQRNSVLCKVTGAFSRTIKINF